VLSSLRRGLKPYMTVDVSDLTRHDIVTAIDALNQIGKPGAAADLRTHARGFLEWAVGQGLAQFNSLAGLRRPGKTRAQRLKTALKGKALTDDEIVRVWRVAQHWQDRSLCGEAVSGSFGALVQLGLLTGMRRSELAQLRRDHIRSDTDKSGVGGERFHIPASITKTGASHAIPITAPARAIIAVQPVTLSPLLLPSARTGGRLRGWGSLVERFQRDSSVKFNLHDLRRTVRTLMSRLGIAEDVAELAIGHQRADLIARYNRDEAWKARVAAFERVSEHVTALLADDDRSNVVLMHGRGQRPTG
jgi:integrase